MKRLIYIILILFCLPIVVNAEEIIINCPKEVQQNEKFECTVQGNADYEVSALSIKYRYDDVSFVEFKTDEIWQGTAYDDNIQLYTDTNKKDIFNIGVLVFKAEKDLNNFKVQNDYSMFSDKEFNEHVFIDNVNNVKSENKKNVSKNNNSIKYVIIILIIVLIVVITILIIRKTNKK